MSSSDGKATSDSSASYDSLKRVLVSDLSASLLRARLPMQIAAFGLAFYGATSIVLFSRFRTPETLSPLYWFVRMPVALVAVLYLWMACWLWQATRRLALAEQSGDLATLEVSLVRLRRVFYGGAAIGVVGIVAAIGAVGERVIAGGPDLSIVPRGSSRVATISSTDILSRNVVFIASRQWNIHWHARGGTEAPPRFELYMRQTDSPGDEAEEVQLVVARTGSGDVPLVTGPGDFELRVVAQDVLWKLTVTEKWD